MINILLTTSFHLIKTLFRSIGYELIKNNIFYVSNIPLDKEIEILGLGCKTTLLNKIKKVIKLNKRYIFKNTLFEEKEIDKAKFNSTSLIIEYSKFLEDRKFYEYRFVNAFLMGIYNKYEGGYLTLCDEGLVKKNFDFFHQLIEKKINLSQFFSRRGFILIYTKPELVHKRYSNRLRKSVGLFKRFKPFLENKQLYIDNFLQYNRKLKVIEQYFEDNGIDYYVITCDFLDARQVEGVTKWIANLK